jgi:hypothetical protein
MGINQQHDILYRSRPVEFRHVCYLLEKRFEGVKDKTTRTKPTVVIDASLIGYSFITQPCGPIGGVIVLAQAFSGESFNVIIIFDNKKRHHSERATIMGEANRERARVQCTQSRVELATLLQHESVDDKDRISELQKQIRKKEGQASRGLPKNFVEEITKFGNEFDDKGRGSITVDAAPFQADPDVAGLALTFAVDAIISGDFDFPPMYVGPSGSGDLMIRSPKICMNSGSVTSMTLVTGQQFIMADIEKVLQVKLPYPIFPLNDKLPEHMPDVERFGTSERAKSRRRIVHQDSVSFTQKIIRFDKQK